MIWVTLLSNWRIVGLVVLFASNALTFALWQQCSDELRLNDLRGRLAAQESKRLVEEQKQITEDTTNGWKAALTVSNDSWAKRLRLANVQPMPGISGPPGGVDGLPADALALASQCSETTLQLKTLQTWVQLQGSAR